MDRLTINVTIGRRLETADDLRELFRELAAGAKAEQERRRLAKAAEEAARPKLTRAKTTRKGKKR